MTAKRVQNNLKVFVKNTSSLRNLLNTSKGRDKFCQLLQYNANLYITCMKTSNEFSHLVMSKQIESFNKAKVFESQISNGRKIFRLFLWLNEINEIHNIIHSDKLTSNLKVFKTVSAVCSFVYYFTDNVVWLQKIGFVSKWVPFSKQVWGDQIKWSKIKDQFSLVKTMLELFIYCYTLHIKNLEDEKLVEKLSSCDDG
mmetsp:Transcript_16911/g.26020  ORF Transcript_16911/g.26020 Transcript_16911/m.26020 type:complete len:198 (-) Transcript_16911:1093-1686(-)